MALRSSISNSDARRLRHAIGLTAALLVAIELALAAVPENVMIRTMHWMRALLAREPAADVQIHGDSVAQSGLYAGEVAAELPPGSRVRNAALQGSGPEFTYFLLKGQIAAGRVPRAIVLAHSPHTLTTQRLSVLAGAFLGWRELPEAFAAGHHVFDTVYGVLCRLSFTLRHRDELSELLRGRRGELRTWGDPVPTERWVRANLAHEEERWTRQGRPPLPPVHEVYRRRFELDPAEREFLARTLVLARAHGIRVYWFTMPEHEALAAVRAPLGFAGDYDRFLDSLATRGEIRVLRRDFVVWPAEEFTDHTHLRLSAAIRTSHELGRELAAAGAGARR